MVRRGRVFLHLSLPLIVTEALKQSVDAEADKQEKVSDRPEKEILQLGRRNVVQCAVHRMPFDNSSQNAPVQINPRPKVEKERQRAEHA